MPVGDVTAELSLVAEAIVQVTLEQAAEQVGDDGPLTRSAGRLLSRFCVVAFGKLGGRELNYSSDIDLLGVYQPLRGTRGDEGPLWNEQFNRLMERLSADLSNHTAEGYAYRVDTRIRPYGTAGALSHTLTNLVHYYLTSASGWEIQALLKMRPVAGAVEIGEKLHARLLPLLTEKREKAEVAGQIEHMRDLALQHGARRDVVDVKNGRGGIRDIEFLVQGLQLVHASENKELLCENTLQALNKLGKAGILPADVAGRLSERYVFLRRVEHFLQLFEDRQVHTLPARREDLAALARRVLGAGHDQSAFLAMLNGYLEDVYRLYREYLL
jgi:glutamate-ammonia-ligase adenylyltransferase